MNNVFDELSKIRKSEPFTPFVLTLRNGRRFEVNRRLGYSFQPDGVIVVGPRDTYEYFKTSDVDHIEVLQPAN